MIFYSNPWSRSSISGKALGAVLIFCMLSACVFAGDESANRAASHQMTTVSSGKPGQLCRRFDVETLNAIKAGDKHLVISIKNYQPPGKNSAGFVAFLLSESKARRVEIMRFGVHPDTAFAAGRKNRPQRFLMPLKDYAADITGDQICVEVGFFSSGTASSGGEAMIELEVADAPK